MSSKWRRFEVLLPLQFNDGGEVPSEWIAEAVLEIVNHFGAASTKPRKWRAIGDMEEFSIAIISFEL
jgi:hypothetical protein